MENITEKLIEYVKKYNILYDLSHPDYKNNRAKNKIWDEIGDIMKINVTYSEEETEIEEPQNVQLPENPHASQNKEVNTELPNTQDDNRNIVLNKRRKKNKHSPVSGVDKVISYLDSANKSRQTKDELDLIFLGYAATRGPKLNVAPGKGISSLSERPPVSESKESECEMGHGFQECEEELEEEVQPDTQTDFSKGEFVLVKFMCLVTHSFVHYVGQITESDDEKVLVNFLRKKSSYKINN
ncbi:alcohol dehydrogenase transcription factor myb/sant-like [Holotrichia oblita]|uniref:Alcohol dehydrogenase transcription factor myb/sant-like n=1 Tax=Holotrichia oblita TaxID=644536 RepID=A0ACB9TGM3_HOLOL|nr:alcohol dehydrogenase transcription factor myb/sant-like [Holotrichia oblita]